MRMPVRALIAALLFAGALTTGARADAPAADQPIPAASPAASPAAPAGAANPTGSSPAPTTQNGGLGGAATTTVRPLPPLSHLPIIDFVGTFTQPAEYSNMSQLPHYDPVDLGGTIRLPVTRKFSLFFDRITEGTLNVPLERVLYAGVPVYGKDTRDIVLQYHGIYSFNRYLSIDIGDAFRHRVFSSGTGPGFAFNTNISSQPYPYTISSTEAHYGYLALIYATKPLRGLLNSSFSFAETANMQNVDHNVAVTCTAPMVAAGINGCTTVGLGGLLDEHPGRSEYYESTQSVTWILPIDQRHGFSLILNDRWGYLNFYENSPFPFRWTTAGSVVLNKRFNNYFNLALRHYDFHSTEQGNPFNTPNAIHVGTYDILATLHVDTNHPFR